MQFIRFLMMSNITLKQKGSWAGLVKSGNSEVKMLKLLHWTCCPMVTLIRVSMAGLFGEGTPTRHIFWVCPVGSPKWIEYLYSKVLIESVHSEDSGWLLSFLWAFQWIRSLALVCGELRALIIRAPSSGSCPLWRHFLLKPPLTPSIRPPLYLLPFFSLPLFFLLQAKVKLILFHNFLSARFLPQRLHLWLSAWKMWLRWRQSEYLCLTNWIMFFPYPYRYSV